MNAKVVITSTDITDAAERQFLPGKLILVSQGDGCTRRLNELCPSDQERTFRARWTSSNILEFEEFTPEPPAALEVTGTGTGENPPAGDGTPPTPEEIAAAQAAAVARTKARAEHVAALKGKLFQRKDADLQETAARLGVAWASEDTRDTKLAKIAEATVAAEEAAAEVESGT